MVYGDTKETTMELDKKGLTKKLLDIILGAPKAHKTPPALNRRTRRIMGAMQQKRNAAPNRRKYERRK